MILVHDWSILTHSFLAIVPQYEIILFVSLAMTFVTIGGIGHCIYRYAANALMLLEMDNPPNVFVSILLNNSQKYICNFINLINISLNFASFPSFSQYWRHSSESA